jgi:cytoskeletal protein CcmA (bactofilin family)
MVFRRDNKSDSFQRQMSALRQQIGTEEEAEARPQQGERRYPSERAAAYSPPQSEPTAGAYGFSEFASSVGPQQAGSKEMTPTAPELPEIPAVDSQTTVIANDTMWKGEIQSNGSVHVHGRLEGAVRANRDVFVAEDADVDATVTANTVVIAGLVKGTIRCESRLEILPSGRVSGDIFAPTFVVHEGATVSGQLRMSNQEPAETKPMSVVQRRAARGTA